jgi:exodeoxyribonuclease VII large subunit
MPRKPHKISKKPMETRPLFDPSMMAPPPPEPSEQSGSGDRPISVSALCRRIDTVLKDAWPRSIRVRGELGSFTDRTHWYFSLKDDDATLSCVMYATRAARAGFRPSPGDEVIATGRLGHFPRQGRTQLYVDALEPVGEGALEAQLRRLVEECRALGWLDPGRKRPLPIFPRRLAIITSRTGAALQDVIDTLKRRCPAIEIAIADTLVQGERAAPMIARTIRSIGADHESLGIDAIICTRGGGSMEDLWCFNDRAVAEAIVRCPVPIVCAIGHETDTTLAELVADARAATPTQAAMLCSPDARALHDQLDSAHARLVASLTRAARLARERHDNRRSRLHSAVLARAHSRSLRLERLALRLARVRPEAVYAQRRTRLDRLHAALSRSVQARLDRFDPGQASQRLRRAVGTAAADARARLDALERELTIAGPISVLRRGYTVTTRSDGALLRSAGDATPGETIRTRFAASAIESTVIGPDGAGPLPPTPPMPQRRRRPATGDPAQRRLFDPDSGTVDP